MKTEDNNNQVVNTKPTSGEVEVLGELRKEKIGKPLIVVELAVLILIVVIVLPIVNSALHDENSTFYQIIHGRVDTPDTPLPEEDEVKNGFELQQLNNSTIMEANNLILKNFSFNGNEINVTIYSYTGVLDLDEEPYYLEVYSNSENKLGYVKLTGFYDSSEKQAVLKSKGLSFNSAVSYFGKIVIMKDSDYPTVTLNNNILKCSKDTRTIEYNFTNNYLSSIKDSETIIRQGMEDSEYLTLKEEYEKKSTLIKGMNTNNESYTEETLTGLSFIANIILEENKDFPEELKDNSYYLYNTEAKVIHYAEEGKGFDCE